MRIVFMGTPEFAVASLSVLVQDRYNVIGVITAPDKPAGRGQQVQMSAVKQFAVANHIPVLQPEKLKDPDFLQALQNLNADLQIVVAFRMLPEVVWNMPPLGTFNLHGSLLPKYRGAAPINRAIMNGETETGVTTFKLKHEIDTGDILLQTKVPILPEDNAGTMHDKLMVAGAELLVVTVKGLAAGTLKEIPQTAITTSELRHAPKLFKEDMSIDWNRSCNEINNFVRGLSPYPTAFTHFGEKTMRVYSVKNEQGETGKAPGAFETDHSTFLRFAAKDGWVYVQELQLEGKKRMPVVDFLRGFRG